MTKLLRAIILAFVSLAIVAPASTLAAGPVNNQSFQISPPTANYAADPGTSVKGVIKVTNLTDQTLVLAVGKQNFVAKGEEGEIELIDGGDPLYSLAPWFNLGTTPLINLAPRATKAFNYTIDVPAGAEPGGRYGSITFKTIAAKLPSGESGAAVEQQIAAIVFLRINGKANEHLNVVSFKPGQSFYEYGPVELITRLSNDGTVHEKATGTITIKNMFGFTSATIPLDEHFVIPGATRQLKNSWPVNGKKKYFFGYYTAHMEATYGDNQKLAADTSFTVIPYKLVAVVFIVLLVLFIFFWRGRKRWGRAFRILAGKE